MAGTFDVKFEDKQVAALISTLINRVENPRPLISRIERYVNAVTQKMFSGKRPDNSAVRGVKWSKLSQETIDQKKVLKQKGRAIATSRPLVRTGKLKNSLKVLKRSAKGFVYGTNVKSAKNFNYPGLHNVGGKPVPKRPWLFMNRQDLRQIVKMSIDYLKGRQKDYKGYVGK